MRDTADRYGTITILNHWLGAAIVIALLVTGLMLEELARGPEKRQLIDLHNAIGMLTLAYLLFRIGWRIKFRFPAELPGPRWQATVAHAVHWILLIDIVVLFVLAPVIVWSTGSDINILDWFAIPSPLARDMALHEAMEEIHEVAAEYVLLPLLVLHILAALKRSVLDKDGTLSRMIGR